MTAAAMNRLVRDLQQSLAAEQLGELADVELLRRVSGGDAAAFEAVVRRHGPAVLAAARAVLANETDVEDVFQAAFLALWRGSRRIRKGTSLGSWLFGVARRAALKALARAKRRRQIEGTKPADERVDSTDLSWREACRVLHEEIDRLPHQYRAPIVLCHLDGRSRDEAAGELGWKLATLRGRLERGRDMLKRRLTRRGVALSAGMLAWLAGDAAEARELSAALVSAALRAPKELPANVVALLPSAAPLARKLTLTVVVLLAAGALSAGLIGGERRSSSPPSFPPTEIATTSPAARVPDDKPAEAKRKPEAKPANIIVLKGQVVDVAGKPVPRARLTAHRWNRADQTNVGFRADGEADAEGRFELRLEGEDVRPQHVVRLIAAAADHAPTALDLPAASAETLTVSMPENAALEGRVLTLEGQPVAGAEVRVTDVSCYDPGDLTKHLEQMKAGRARVAADGVRPHVVSLAAYGYILPHLAVPARTDRDGRFRIPDIGRDRLVDFSISGPTIKHVELLARTQAGPAIRINSTDGSFQVLGSSFDHLARPARLLRGVVRVRGTGNPVAGATVTAAESIASVVTDAEGRFDLPGCAKGPQYNLTVTPPVGAPLFVAERRLQDGPGLAPLPADVELLGGIALRGRLLDEKTGKAVSGTVAYVPWPGNEVLAPKRDASGTLHRTTYPKALPVAADGSFAVTVAPGRGLVLARASTMTAFMSAHFNSKEAFGFDALPEALRGTFESDSIFIPTENGGYTVDGASAYHQVVPLNRPTRASPLNFDVKLTPATTVRVRFLDPDGNPLTDLLTPSYSFRPWTPVPNGEIVFSGLNPKRPKRVIVMHPKLGLCGYVKVTGVETRAFEVRLHPAATVRGRLLAADGEPLARFVVNVTLERLESKESKLLLTMPEQTVTDAEGRFEIKGLLPNVDLGVTVGKVYEGPAPPEKAPPHAYKQVALLKPGEDRDIGTLTPETKE